MEQMSEVEKLLRALEIVSESMTDDILKDANQEQLLEYSNLINKIKAKIISQI